MKVLKVSQCEKALGVKSKVKQWSGQRQARQAGKEASVRDLRKLEGGERQRSWVPDPLP